MKIKIRLPATVVQLGAGLAGVGLALGLYTSVEVSPRTDDALIVEPHGEGAGRYSVGWSHPVVLALMRVFQKLERAPTGLSIRIENQIPVASGLGAESAFMLAGVVAGNNLMGSPFSRDVALDLASHITRPDAVTCAMFGGLASAFLHHNQLVYRPIPATQIQVVVVLPDLPNYARPHLGERVATADMLHNMSRLPLLIEGFRRGDLDLIALTLDDAILQPHAIPQIPAYDAVCQAGKAVGARAVSLAGEGPALIAFTEKHHAQVATAMISAFAHAHIPARSWVLPIDTQGIVLSIMG